MFERNLRKPFFRMFAACSIGLLATASISDALARNHSVTADTSQVNCNVFNGGVQAGDTIVLAAGARGPLEIRNCRGTKTNPIIVKNDSTGREPTVIRRSSSNSGGFVLSCTDCEHFILDGTDGWSGAPATKSCGDPTGGNTCGIQVTSISQGDAPSAYISFNGSSSDFIVRGVEVDGRWPDLSRNGIGITVNDHDYNLAEHPGEWRENILIENSYIHNVEGECLYIGPNWEFDGSVNDLKLRNIEIANNFISDCGWDGIQLKSAIEGVNRIHRNVVLRAGQSNDDSAGQHIGISLYESGNGLIHHNWIEDSGEHGIQHFLHRIPASYGPLKSSIYNNVVVSPGRTGPQPGKGITVSRNADAAEPLAHIYNNTVIGSEHIGIFIGESVNSRGTIRNNIVADSGDSAIAAANSTTRSNNITGSTAVMRFVDATNGDYRLRSDSSAVDAGNAQTFAQDDFRGIPRPQGTGPDIGAYERTNSPNDVRPNPPTLAAEP